MRVKTVAGLWCLLVVVLPVVASAQTVYSDGQNHNVSGASGPIQLQNDGTSLTVLPGALVAGAVAFQQGVAITGGAGTAINVLGGTLQGAGGADEIHTSGSVAIFGGTLGAVAVGLGTPNATPGTLLMAGGTLTNLVINGSGQIFGGAIQGVDGVGGNAIEAGGTDLSISGGIFQGGSTQHVGLTGFGLALESFGVQSLAISGGTFQAGAADSGFQDPFTSFIAANGNDLTQISGGQFDARTGGFGIHYALSYSSAGDAAAVISGGQFSGAIGFNLADSSSLSFIGSGLVFDPVADVLTGTLDDGSPIDSYLGILNPVTTYQYGVAPDGSEMLTFSQPQGVPEPSSVVMLVVGVVAVVFVKTRFGTA